MAVLIKNEKMPISCARCFYWKKCHRLIQRINEDEDPEGEWIPYSYILDNCPISEVQEEE